MKKYDREANVRTWEGVPKILVNIALASFAIFCIYVTLFTSWLEEVRLTSFMACIILIGYLMYLVKKGKQKTDDETVADLLDNTENDVKNDGAVTE